MCGRRLAPAAAKKDIKDDTTVHRSAVVLIDTDICSAYLKNVRSVSNRFLQYGGLYVSVVTIAQLGTWLWRRRTPPRYRQAYAGFLHDVTFLDLDLLIAERAAVVGATLADKGRSMENADLLIAATALEHNLTLVTHNTPDFVYVPNLTLADWLSP
jgi:predicted nucleic acid-binding protein